MPRYSFSLQNKWAGCEVTCGANQVSEEERVNVTAVQNVKRAHSVSASVPHDVAQHLQFNPVNIFISLNFSI
jgi:hypothetical protein